MLSMEAYLSLYDSTREAKWLERTKAAADFAESWIWIWNVPMPEDADNAKLHYKKGVPTIGVQGITAAVSGGVDEYLDWAVPFLREAVQPDEGPALPRRGARPAARHEVHGRSSGTPVRREGHRVATGGLAHGSGDPGAASGATASGCRGFPRTTSTEWRDWKSTTRRCTSCCRTKPAAAAAVTRAK